MAKTRKQTPTSNIGFEETLWATADKMRNNMDPAEYKHVVLGLIFLKYISDSFEEVYTQIKADPDHYEGQEEDRDAYVGESVFWVPKEARWEYLKSNAKKPEIGKMIDDAMVAIEKDNATLKGVLSKNYVRPDLDKVRLGELIDLVGTIGLGDKESRSKDVLGRVYEYFLGRFASAEGKGGGEFFTPQCVVKLLVEMLEPFKGRVYDPCCGSGGMFVQSERFAEAHGGSKHDISVYGQESNPTTWRLCKMNLAIRGIEGNLGLHNADTFHNDLHKDLKADYILANPPFNISDWGGERLKDDVRWKYGVPPAGNANYGWIQHMIHHLSPTGIAGFVLANGSLSSNTSGEGDIRKNLITNGLVDCIVAMPTQLFYTTQIPVCLWFVSRDRHDHKFRDRHDEILFIDARKMGSMISRKNKELTAEDIAKIADVYHCWRTKDCKYSDVKGFCKAAKIVEVEKSGYVLTPGRYVGTDVIEEDDEVFEEKMGKLTKELAEQFERSKELEERIKTNLKSIGFEI
ncbi:MAG: class I SAM-dependent DNA methyltransferase [Patescibacteria group bacterium]